MLKIPPTPLFKKGGIKKRFLLRRFTPTAIHIQPIQGWSFYISGFRYQVSNFKYLWLVITLFLFSSISEGQDIPAAPDTISISAIVDTAAVISDTVMAKRHSPSGAMWRSMALPGWGQIYNRKYLKAAVYGGGEIALFYASLVQNRRYKQAREDEDWTAADFYENDRNRLRWWLAGLILFNMADAFVDGHLWDFELEKDLSASVEGNLFVIKVRF